MNNLLKRMTVIWMLLMVTSTFVSGQNSVLPPVASTPDILSAVFHKNDVLDVDMYSGRASVDIPLYVYKDQDFELPIQLRYSSGGYRPNEPIGFVGIGWNLECGGTITRRIKGGPDEGPGTLYNGLFGYHLFYKSQKYPVDYDRILREGEASRYDRKSMFGWDLKETTPDEFAFNFMGYKGIFYLGPDTIYVCHTNGPQGEFKVEVGMEDEPAYDLFFFKITTSDGKIYTFRNAASNTYERNAVGYNKHQKFDNSINSASKSIRRTPMQVWSLMEVEAPNGRKIRFSYLDVQKYLLSQYWYDTHFFWDENPLECILDDNGTEMAKGYLITSELLFPLDKIEIDDTRISFQYTYRTPEVNDTKYFTATSVLSFLTVSYQSKVVKKCGFSYAYPKNAQARGCRPILFLKKVDLTADGTFTFDYYDEDGYYRPAGQGTDFWGYSDGTLGPTYPFLHRFDENYVETIRYQEDFAPLFKETRKSMLQKITYPTKGYTKFYYSQNNYGAKVTKDLTHKNEPYLSYFGDITGGVKIDKITTYTNDNDSTFRRFDYRMLDYDNMRYDMSGILLHEPRFHRIAYDLQGNTVRREFSMRGTFIQTQDDSHIGYSQVFEDLPDGSCWHYTFSDYQSLPDIPYDKVNVKPISNWDWNVSQIRPLYIDEFYAKYDSRHTQRGKLIQKAAYDKNRKIKYVEKYIYDYTKPLAYFVTIANAYSYHYKQKTFIEDYPLVRVEKTYYPSDEKEKVFTEITHYSYNKLGQVINKEIETSDGECVSEKSQYVSDLPEASRSEAHKQMLARNMLKYSIRTQTSTSDEGIIGGSYSKYEMAGHAFPIISETWKLETSAPLATSDFAFDSSLYKDFTYQYDNAGRLIGITDRDGLMTTYVWGRLNMLAEVKGASPQTVMQVLQPGKDYRTPMMLDYLGSDLSSALRNIEHCMVTVFEHKALVGVTMVGDASNRVIRYQYNAEGQLVKVDDERDCKLTEYEYHKK